MKKEKLEKEEQKLLDLISEITTKIIPKLQEVKGVVFEEEITKIKNKVQIIEEQLKGFEQPGFLVKILILIIISLVVPSVTFWLVNWNIIPFQTCLVGLIMLIPILKTFLKSSRSMINVNKKEE